MVKDRAQETADMLHTVVVRLLRRAATADVGMSLDGPRASLLSVLVYGGPLPITRLAEIERVSPPAITKLVDALEAANLVRRNRSQHDRRVVLVEPTSAGRRTLERGRLARVRLIADLLNDATPDELATLDEAATILRSRLESVAPRPRPA
jgi:DNA-binding MarR family transcriptional regulator